MAVIGYRNAEPSTRQIDLARKAANHSIDIPDAIAAQRGVSDMLASAISVAPLIDEYRGRGDVVGSQILYRFRKCAPSRPMNAPRQPMASYCVVMLAAARI